MAYKFEVDIVDADGKIRVTHSFWGLTAKDAEDVMEAHLETDTALAAAVAEDRAIEDTEEIDDEDLPEVEEEEEAEEDEGEPE